jgi:hypothetical protein
VGTTQDPGEDADRLYARSWRITGAGRPDVSALRDLVEVLVPALERLEGYRGGSMLIADGALVVTEGAALEVSICDVVMSHPVPRHLTPDLRSATRG